MTFVGNTKCTSPRTYIHWFCINLHNRTCSRRHYVPTKNLMFSFIIYCSFCLRHYYKYLAISTNSDLKIMYLCYKMHFIFVGNAKQSLSQLKPEVKRVKARLISQLVKIATSFLATPGIREN